MGLFSTLASATGSSSTTNKDGETTVQTKTTSSATIATVVQLYSNQEINLVEGPMPAAANSGGATQGGYSSFTYQAVQVGATTHDDTNNSNEWKNKHSNPDLGVWNCRVPNNVVAAKKENSDPQLVDSLLANLAKTSSSSDESTTAFRRFAPFTFFWRALVFTAFPKVMTGFPLAWHPLQIE